MSVKRSVTVPSGAAARSTACGIARCSSYGRVPAPARSGAAWAPRPTPQPSSDQIGQNSPPPVRAQIAISITFTSTKIVAWIFTDVRSARPPRVTTRFGVGAPGEAATGRSAV